MKPSRPGLLLICSIWFSGCSFVSYDATHSKAAKNLITDCHATNIETSIFHFDPNKSEITKKGGTYIIQSGFPTNEWEVTRYADDWREVAVIPIGTKFRVTRVYDQGWGNQGRFWLVYARLQDPLLFDREFIVPSGNFTQTGQIWVTPVSPDGNGTPLRLQDNFTVPCKA